MSKHTVIVQQLCSGGDAFLNVTAHFGHVGVWAFQGEGPTHRNGLYQYQSKNGPIVYFIQFNDEACQEEWELENPECVKLWPVSSTEEVNTDAQDVGKTT